MGRRAEDAGDRRSQGDDAAIVDVALVGAGRIGLPIVRNLVRAGHAVIAYDVRDEREQDVRAVGATWSDHVTGALVLLTVLPGNPEPDPEAPV
ncbi:NAD(P)-binding domain-containing protein [Kribbella pittospori]